ADVPRPTGKRAQARTEPGRTRRIARADRCGRRPGPEPDRARPARWRAAAAGLPATRPAGGAGDGPARAERIAGAAGRDGRRAGRRAGGTAGDRAWYPPGHLDRWRAQPRAQDTGPA